MTPLTWRRWKKIHHKDILKIMNATVLGYIIPVGLLYYGLTLTKSINASIIGTIEPLIIYFLAIEVLKEAFNLKILGGLLLSMSGALLIVFRPAIGDVSVTENLLGNLLILASITSSAIGTVMTKPILNKFKNNILEIAQIRMYITSIPFLVISILNFGQYSKINIPAQAWMAVVYGIIFAVVIASPLYHIGLQKIDGEETGLFQYLSPVFGVIFAVILLGEKIDLFFVFGSALIVLGILLAEVKHKFHIAYHHQHKH